MAKKNTCNTHKNKEHRNVNNLQTNVNVRNINEIIRTQFNEQISRGEPKTIKNGENEK